MAAMFRVFKAKWITPHKEVHEDYTGKIVMVTGATSGLGKEAAFKFAAMGASKVIITARDTKKGVSTKTALEARLGRADQLEVWELDMMSYDSVRAFAKRATELDHLDVAVLNAGTRRVRFTQSSYGWEEDLQTNTLSTTLIAILLLPKLKETKQHTGKTPILEFLNSGLHQDAIVPPEVRTEPSVLGYYNTQEHFKEGSQYSFSKVFLMYATKKLADEISSQNVIITSICPGWVVTELGRDHYFPGVFILAFFFVFLFMQSPGQGAKMILSGTAQGKSVHGRFWKNDQMQPIPPSLTGTEMKELSERMWQEILDALEKDVPDVRKASILHHSCRRSVGWMPKLPSRRKPFAPSPSSLVRFLFPQTRARARFHLAKFRHDTLPALRHGAQSRIYRYIVYRQGLKLKGRRSILQRLRGYTRSLGSTSYLEDAARLRRQQIVKRPEQKELGQREMTYQESYEARDPGSRRRKLAGYLKAANEIRQTYTQQYAPNWSSKEAQYDYEEDAPGSFPDAAVVRSGEEEMILFPSYARRHVKRKPEAQPGTIQQAEGEGRDVRDSTGAGDAEFWKQQWDNYEDDNAVVDVDVRGWIYSPHKGQMSRKQRLFIGLARQLVGVQAPPTPSTSSADSSRDASPQRHGFRERAHLRDAQYDEAIAAREAEEILRKGEQEARAAARGAYSEKPAQDNEDTQLYRTESGGSMLPSNAGARPLARSTSKDSLRSEASITPLQKRGSWTQPSDMSAAELAEANARLMARLRHFLAIPMANTPISIFFYNDRISKQRTVYTDAAGHFSMSAALDFVPTHIRILASDKLSATEEVIITASQGISVISDIDDTIKHSAIGNGAREIFRNVFIRDLLDLTINGVREWYNKMAELGVKFHYVSNSPWQLYPVISKYFSLAGLPPGSFHLKQYSGMLQGIFEPVAERKKVTLDKIARDFPERNFILIGDSGEADLEVYTDFVLENPGRVVAVFIRDVTTTDSPGFFEPSMGFNPGDRSSSSSQRTGGGASNASSRARAPSDENDPELNAAIAASLRDMEKDNAKRSKSMFPQTDRDHPDTRPMLPERKPSSQISSQQGSTPNLIDLSSDDEVDQSPALRRFNTDTMAKNEKHRVSVASNTSAKSAPPPPKKPVALRSPSSDSASFNLPSPSTSKPQPSKPRKPPKTVNQPSPLSQQEIAPRSANPATSSRPPVAPKPTMSYQSQSADDEESYTGMARNKLLSVYNHLPALRSQEEPSSNASSLDVQSTKKAPPPPPPRRTNRDAASSAASYVGNKASAAWQHAPSIPYHSRPQITSAQTAQPFSTATSRQGVNRTNTGSTTGTVEQYGSKKEQLWRQRWATAEQTLKEQGVILRGWRVGGDIMGEAERIIKEADKKFKQNEERSEGRGRQQPSSKGKPTDPKLREKVKQDVKQETNKDGSGKGQWSAWKASKLSKEYEKKGGGYENEAGSKNEPRKGAPRAKAEGRKQAEVEMVEGAGGDEGGSAQGEGEEDEEAPAKPKANTGAKKSGVKSVSVDKEGGGLEDKGKGKGKGKERSEGTRRSARVAGKRKVDEEEEEGVDDGTTAKKGGKKKSKA
ncbi:hypothetical protein BDW02DRAFT_531603 [Decorospora gaudefroyi]|uniref:Phosphatidate phosphatase APP1 catalytic domain-containing protein n=1 Tax=Decorospora gaudefroyi TaxID=184978 RepID=A0A6A5K5C9_9PLEO|nr:hypothetical protein BDW02DRAFT_531603 [Decorospora gaudefroyi]